MVRTTRMPVVTKSIVPRSHQGSTGTTSSGRGAWSVGSVGSVEFKGAGTIASPRGRCKRKFQPSVARMIPSGGGRLAGLRPALGRLGEAEHRLLDTAAVLFELLAVGLRRHADGLGGDAGGPA